MPPKNKNKNKKGGKAKKGTSTDVKDEVSKEELEEQIISLRKDLQVEQQEWRNFQLERDKVFAFWEISKRTLEETKAELRNRQREREEAEEPRRAEIMTYKQKLKHVLNESHSSASVLKIDAVAINSVIQNEHSEVELGMWKEVHDMKADYRQKKVYNTNCLKELKLKNQVEVMELSNSYCKIISEIEAKYQKNMQSLMDGEEKIRRAEIIELEERMKTRKIALVEEHDRALRGAEEYYSAAQKKLLVDQRVLKDELEDAIRQQGRSEKDLSEAQQENKCLRATLQEAEYKLPELQKQLEEHNQAKAKMAASRARAKVIEKELRHVKLDYELLLEAFEQAQQARDTLLKSQTEILLDVQQKSGLKELLLERKLAVLTETLEKREAQLCGLLSASAGEHTAGSGPSNKLEEILESKRVTVDVLQSELARDCKEYDKQLQTCQEKLKDLGLHLINFPLKPSKQILSEHSRVQNSSAPATMS